MNVVGSGNTALIDQNGSGNKALTIGQPTEINQDGDFNEIDTEQNGRDNEIGVNKFIQTNNNNEADVLQNGRENIIKSVNQRGRSGLTRALPITS